MIIVRNLVKLMKLPNKLSWRNGTLRQKIFLALLAVSIPAILLLGAFSMALGKSIDDQTQQDYYTNSLEQAVRNINQSANRLTSSMYTVIFNSGIANMFETADPENDRFGFYLNLRDYFDPTLSLLRESEALIDEIYFYTDSKIAGSRLNIVDIKSEETPAYVKNFKEKKEIQYIEDGEMVVALSVIPQRGLGGTRTIVAIHSLKEDFFAGLGTNLSGQYITVSDKSQVIYQTKEEKNVRYQAFDADKKIGDTGWHATLHYNRNSLVAPEFLKLMIVTVIGVIALVVAAAMYFNRSINKNFVKLSEKIAKATESPDEAVDFRTSQQDEFGQLSNSIGVMVQEINELNRRVLDYQSDQQKSEYNALVNQIDSHLLYNTLSLINWQAIESDNLMLSVAVQELSKFYRTTLNHGKAHTKLASELDNVKAYITLQLLLDDSFQVYYEVDPTLLNMQVINLIIQPIVENAIEHGFKDKPADAEIVLSTYSTGPETFEINVTDNGCGMDEATMKSILDGTGTSHGMFNVNKRIKFYFGEAYGLKITSRIGIGTSVSIMLPKIKDERSGEDGTEVTNVGNQIK